MLKYEYSFQPHEPNQTASAVAEFALSGGLDVLDIGSGPAWVSRYLAGEHGRRITCLDYDRDALAALAEAGIEGHWADIESDGWSDPIEGRSFDVVILADVLEHLRNPGAVLTNLVDKQLLRPEGILVVSVPNASHESVLAELASGDFNYTETGILDETHVRWFTPESLSRLLERSGFLIDRTHRTKRLLESVGHPERAATVPSEFRKVLRGLHEDADTYQVVVRARPQTAATVVAQQREVIEAERLDWFRERDALTRELKAANAERDRVRALLVRERDDMLQALRQGRAELEEARKEVKAARRDAQPAEIYRSRGVRLAVKVVTLTRRARGRLKRHRR